MIVHLSLLCVKYIIAGIWRVFCAGCGELGGWRHLTSRKGGRAGWFPGPLGQVRRPQPVDPSCFAALPKELAARETAGFHREVNRA
jgi:hypothetical protein